MLGEAGARGQDPKEGDTVSDELRHEITRREPPPSQFQASQRLRELAGWNSLARHLRR
jgi:hypothetical protein